MHATLKALVVDDSPSMRQRVVDVLVAMACFNVAQADDGAAALKQLRHQRFDLVITDVNMPTMDGLKLTQMVRHDPVHRNVPVIIVTSEHATHDRNRAMALGANAYLLKPADVHELQQTVQRLLMLGDFGAP